MKCDFHIHSYYSYDGSSSPEEIIKDAIKKGIDCIAITDHEEIKGAMEAQKKAADSILIIPGIEIKSRQGDILGLNVKNVIPKGLTAKDTIKKIKEQGGVVVIPHPFAAFYPFKGNLENILELIDAIEVLNGSTFQRDNKKALDFVKKHNLPFIAGSDAHCSKEIGQVYLEIPGNNLSIEQVLEAVKNKKGKLGGEKANFLNLAIFHAKRNIAKLNHYAGRKKRKL
jgi:predicted metal-dependent phosphoesterase TrpH